MEEGVPFTLHQDSPVVRPDVMLAVKNDGFDIPTDVLTFTEGADAVEAYILQRTDKKDHS